MDHHRNDREIDTQKLCDVAAVFVSTIQNLIISGGESRMENALYRLENAAELALVILRMEKVTGFVPATAEGKQCRCRHSRMPAQRA